MLARLEHRPFSDPSWIYERKFDGERCIIERHGPRIRLLSRNRKSLNRTYPEIVAAIRRQPLAHFVVDGEIVAFEGRRTSFARLQSRLGVRDPDAALRRLVPVYAYLFDALLLDHRDVRRLPLVERRRRLRRSLRFGRRLRWSAHRRGDALAFLRRACRMGWEGILAKRAESPYVPRRSPDWRKFKCVRRQEFVIGGFTEPKGSRAGLGAILVGYYRGASLHYVGKVGTGFSAAVLTSLRRRLASVERASKPFCGEVRETNAHWTRPTLVAEIGFSEWTRDGRLRHPRFLGLRRDKRARDVVRER